MPVDGDGPALIWRARDDSGERGDTRRLAHVIAPADASPCAGEPALIGFACDAGVRRAIRAMMAGLPAHGMDVLYDAGDVYCDDGDLEAAQDRYAGEVARLLETGSRVLALGGGHEIAWGSFMGLRRWLDVRSDTAPVLVLNLDAHFDLRTGRPASSGTPFDQIAVYCAKRGLPWQYACLGVSRVSNTAALYARAQEVRAFWLEDVDMGEGKLEASLCEVDRLLDAAAHVYLTVDLDVLPAPVMPGVSAPAAYGVPIAVVERIVAHVAASGKLRLADLAEINPRFDLDHRSARVAARLAWRILDAWR